MSSGATGTHFLHDPDPAVLNEIPTFQGNSSLPIPPTAFGPGSAYPTMITRPRAHTSADSSPNTMGGGMFSGMQARQPSRNSIVPGQHPGMASRHVSTSVLDSNGRLRGDGGAGTGAGPGSGGGMGTIVSGAATGGVGGASGNGGGQFSMGSPPPMHMAILPPPPPPPPPPPLPKDPGYHPGYATAVRSHGREGMMSYYGHQQHLQQQPQQQYGAYTPHQHPPLSSSVPKAQLTPLSVPLHNGVNPANASAVNGNGVYTPHIHHHHLPPHHPQRPPPEVPMYRQPSAQSSESLTSFVRTESSESDYMTPATVHSTGSSIVVQTGNRSVSASNQNPSGITRSSHVSHSQQSPLVASNSAGPLSPDVATVWTLDRVVNYLDRHEFSQEWQQAFRNLNIYGKDFLDMGSHKSTSLLQHVHPEVLRICGPSADPAKEMQAAKNIKKMVREILKLSREVPNTPPSSAPNHQIFSAERGESPSKQPAQSTGSARSPNQKRFSTVRSTTLPVVLTDGSNNSSNEPFLSRGGSESMLQNRTAGSDSVSRGRNEFTKGALGNVDQVQGRHSPSNSETSIRDPSDGYGYGSAGKSTLASSPRSSPSLGFQSISTRHGKSNSTESVASSTVSHRAGDGKGKEKALIVLGITPGHQQPSPRHDTHEMKSGGTKIVDKFRKRFRREARDDDSMDNGDDSPTSPSWRSQVPNLPFAIPEHNTSDSSLDRHSIPSEDGLRGRHKNPRSTGGGTAGNQGKKFVFVTRDGKIWVLVEISNLDTVDAVRKEICENLAISEWDAAQIHLTEVGQGATGIFYSSHIFIYSRSLTHCLQTNLSRTRC